MDRYAQVGDGEKVAYRLDGPKEAPVVVLSHSLGTDMRLWDGQVDALAAHYRVLRYDMRGHGKSSVPLGPYVLARLGQDVLDLLQSLGIQQVSFCGLSLGGMVGQWLGHHAPQRIRCLSLCNTSADMGPPRNWDERIATVRTLGLAAISESVLGRWFTPTFQADSPKVVEFARSMLMATPTDGYTGCCAAIRDMHLRGLTSCISVPTLVVAGSSDMATPRSHADSLLKQVINGRLTMLPAAHLSNLEQPKAFSAALEGFLDEINGAV